jgi:hypothetical protein
MERATRVSPVFFSAKQAKNLLDECAVESEHQDHSITDRTQHLSTLVPDGVSSIDRP